MDQTQKSLQGRPLTRAIFILNAANGVSFIDLLSITTVIPVIAVEMHATAILGWAATSQLIGATIGQCILGYLSDFYSRRKMLETAFLILAISTIGCGLSKYSNSVVMLLVFRGLCGIATGSISNLVNITQNDLVPAEKRPKDQGIQGLCVAVGSIAGVFAGSAFSSILGRWECVYWMETVLALGMLGLVHAFVPVNSNVEPPPERSNWSIIKSTDIAGIVAGSAFAIPGLILIAQGNRLGPRSPITIALIVVTVLSFTTFIYLGLKDRGVRHVVPFELFMNRTIVVILVQNVFLGAAYYTLMYFLPINFQVVRKLTAIESATFITPYMLMHGIWTTASGFIISFLQRRGHASYSYILTFGFGIWTLAMCLLAFFSGKSQVDAILIAFLGVLVGFGTGSVFQNSIMAIRAQVTAEKNATAVSTRNVLRFFGGALGTAISSTIMESRMTALLPAHLQGVSQIVFARLPESLSPADAVLVQEAYAGAISLVFYIAAAMVGLCFLLCPLIKDTRTPKSNLDVDVEKAASTVEEGNG
jgi:MFS family permease